MRHWQVFFWCYLFLFESILWWSIRSWHGCQQACHSGLQHWVAYLVGILNYECPTKYTCVCYRHSTARYNSVLSACDKGHRWQEAGAAGRRHCFWRPDNQNKENKTKETKENETKQRIQNNTNWKAKADQAPLHPSTSPTLHPPAQNAQRPTASTFPPWIQYSFTEPVYMLCSWGRNPEEP